jgi:hypothetical protein
MACGCKKKSNETTQQTATIRMTENQSSSNPQTVTVQEQQVQAIVDRIKEMNSTQPEQ